MRRPAKLERAGALTPRDRIWAAIRAFGLADSWSVAEIMVLSEQRADTVLSYLRGLEKAGYIRRPEARIAPPRTAARPVARPRREFAVFCLVRDIGVEAPRVGADGKPVTQGIGREQLWRAMRILRGDFNWCELVAAASTERHVVSMDEAKTYVKFLARAGYLVLMRASRGTQPARYRFMRARDTGPRAPLIARDKSVMDGNTGQIVLQGGKS